MNYIELKTCTKNYFKNKEKISAVKNVTYKFTKGTFYVIVGNSGSGKSTLLHCMGTLDNFSNGIIKINGMDISKLSNNDLADLRRDNIGFVFQSFYLNPSLTALQNVMLPLYLIKNMSKQERLIKANKILETVGLSNRKNHLPKELSGGEQQRVAIARALANDPNIILADEPTGNLDKKNEKLIYEIFKKLVLNGKCVIVVSHNENILKYADIILSMNNGTLEKKIWTNKYIENIA